MGKLKLLVSTVLIVILLLSFSSIHEYYLSIANISINKETNQLELELKLDAEDFEKVLSIGQEKNVNFDEVDETEIKLISSYLSEHLIFFINGGNAKLRMIGEELNPDGYFCCYLVVDLPEITHSIKIKNTLLLPFFLQQHNIVNLKVNGQTKSHTFITKHTTYTFKIDAN